LVIVFQLTVLNGTAGKPSGKYNLIVAIAHMINRWVIKNYWLIETSIITIIYLLFLCGFSSRGPTKTKSG
jgi:hypothetical protein